jgi:flagellar protein FlaJ
MGIVERVARMVERVFPKKFLSDIELKLESTNIALTGEEFIATALLITLGICIGIVVAGVFLGPSPFILSMVLISIAVVFPMLMLGVPYYLTQRRVAELDRMLPDALRQMASTLRAGIGIDAAMEDIVKSKYGALSREFERAVMEIRRGRSLGSALLSLARRSGSILYDRAFRLIVEGVERGAAIANVLDAVSDDVREVQAIQRERRASTMQQVLFLFVVALFAAPLISGLTVAVGGIFSGAAGVTTVNALPPEISTIVMLYVVIQAFICALAVGVIRYGQMSKGLTFTLPFMLIAGGVFFAARIMMGFVTPA